MLDYKVVLSNLSQLCLGTVKSTVHNQSSKFVSAEGFSEGNELKNSGTHPDLLIFDLSCIVAPTENFSPTNKLRQGDFGPVFKVQLQFIDIVDILRIFICFIFHYCKVGPIFFFLLIICNDIETQETEQTR